MHLSSDGVPVVIHDEKVDRTTDGSGWVGRMPFAQLRRLNASGRFGGQTGQIRIPALQEVLEWCRETRLRLNLELKTNVCEYPGIEQKVIEMVFGMGMQDRIIFSSFNHYTMLRCKKITPQILCGALEESWIVGLGGYVKELGLECVHPQHWYLTDENMAQLKKQGLRVHAWTVKPAGADAPSDQLGSGYHYYKLSGSADRGAAAYHLARPKTGLGKCGDKKIGCRKENL